MKGPTSVTFAGRAGFFQSIREWVPHFEVGSDFRYTVVESSHDEVTVRIETSLKVKSQDGPNELSPTPHCWMERFRFDQNNLISRLDVYMNLNRDCDHAFDRFDMNLAMRAAARGDLDAIDQLIKQGADLSVLNSNGAGVLYFASQAAHNSKAIFDHVRARLGDERLWSLLQRQVTSNGHTVLLEAVFNINEEMVDTVLGFIKEMSPTHPVAPGLTLPTVFGWTPRTFAEREKLAFALRIPEGGLKAAERPQWLAEQERAFQQSLESLPAERRARETLGAALLTAVGNLDVAAMQMALDQGAQLNETYGRLSATALNTTVKPGMSDPDLAKAKLMQDELFRLGANPNLAEGGIMKVPSGFRESVFGYASLIENMLSKLQVGSPERDAYLNYRGPVNGYSKLIDAALRGRTEVIRVLIHAGADKTIRAHSGITALDAALLYNRKATGPLIPEEVLTLLRDEPQAGPVRVSGLMTSADCLRKLRRQ